MRYELPLTHRAPRSTSTASDANAEKARRSFAQAEAALRGAGIGFVVSMPTANDPALAA